MMCIEEMDDNASDTDMIMENNYIVEEENSSSSEIALPCIIQEQQQQQHFQFEILDEQEHQAVKPSRKRKQTHDYTSEIEEPTEKRPRTTTIVPCTS